MTTHDDAPRVDHRSPDAAPAEERAAVPPARRRAPRRDELLAAAVDTARAGLAGQVVGIGHAQYLAGFR
mgnify:CR=1 FL=1